MKKTPEKGNGPIERDISTEPAFTLPYGAKKRRVQNDEELRVRRMDSEG
jgi:hypothetical protein